MRVLFASSEVFPLAKTGGLGDVSGALPAALTEAGTDIRVLMPAYPEALDLAEGKRQVGDLGDPFGIGDTVSLVSAKLPGSGVPLWLLDCPAMYRRAGGLYQDRAGNDYPDNLLRFGLLSWAAARLSTEDSPVKWRPQVLHGNDWQTGLAPAYLHAWVPAERPATVFTIHNIAYQGVFPKDSVPRLGLPWELFQMEGLEFYDQLSFLKAGLFYSDRLTTVSPRYAREIQAAPHGSGMEGLLAHRAADLDGILNGADYRVWTPDSDPFLPHTYVPSDFTAGKAANKAALQAELGLAIDPAAPLLVVVSRINDLKGLDMVLAAMPALLRMGAQVAVVGTGDHSLEEGFRAAAATSPRQVAVTIGYSEKLAHQLLAAGDMLLMPSRFEPCGLTQFYAFRYGTVPVVHATGGLADTVVDATYDGLMTGTATGFTFEHANAGAFQWCVERAVGLFRQPETWTKIQKTCVAQDFSWKRSAARYQSLYQGLVPQAGGKRRKGGV
ncbi:glycogen synthase GlgA [Magnetospirillum moscoviense]|uniref:Glycogen synthase n=1 Tax=Magnetospirillum moscoviense TaxID=1437059 RepID=A0A178MZN9_9PROT|nr:glycogen synthase GlgA [Magnetospirillum moscoviense]OAN67008.1 starch synthase [Magnetospirillum moscoviense]